MNTPKMYPYHIDETFAPTRLAVECELTKDNLLELEAQSFFTHVFANGNGKNVTMLHLSNRVHDYREVVEWIRNWLDQKTSGLSTSWFDALEDSEASKQEGDES